MSVDLTVVYLGLGIYFGLGFCFGCTLLWTMIMLDQGRHPLGFLLSAKNKAEAEQHSGKLLDAVGDHRLFFVGIMTVGWPWVLFGHSGKDSS